MRALTFGHVDNKQQAARGGGVEELLAVLIAQPTDEGVQEAACAALASLCTDAAVAQKAGEANAVQVVLATLHALPDCATTCEEACRALWNLVRCCRATALWHFVASHST